METLERVSGREKKGRKRHRLMFFLDVSFLNGMASTLELFGRGQRLAFYPNRFEADREALRRDCRAVGNDFRQASRHYESILRFYYNEGRLSDPELQERLFDPDSLETRKG